MRILLAFGNTLKWKSQHAGIFSAYQGRTSVHASHIEWRGQELVLEGVAHAKYDSVHASVVNTALQYRKIPLMSPGRILCRVSKTGRMFGHGLILGHGRHFGRNLKEINQSTTHC